MKNYIQKYWKTIPTQFLKISRVLPPRRILRKPGFIYISSDSAMICPEFGRILFIISIGTWIYKNIEKNIPTQFLKISRVLPPRRILRKPGFIYISSDSAMICPEFGRILFIISIGTLIPTKILKNYIQKYFLKTIPTQFLKISRVLPPRRILRKPGFIYISSDSAMICPEFGRILFIISIGTWIY